MKKPATKPASAPVEPEPVVEVIDLPEVGEIVIRDGLPMIVTRVGQTSFSGRVFGTVAERFMAENTTFGDGPGQCQRKS